MYFVPSGTVCDRLTEFDVFDTCQVPGQDAVPMWRAFGNQGDVWSMARIPVPHKEANKGYQVSFSYLAKHAISQSLMA